MQQDLVDAAQWLIKNRIAPKDKVAIYGGSYGGYASLAALTFTPDMFACGVASVAPSSLITLIRNIPANLKDEHTRRMAGGDIDPETPEGREVLRSVSPVYHADRIKKPILIEHVIFSSCYSVKKSWIFKEIFLFKISKIGANYQWVLKTID